MATVVIVDDNTCSCQFLERLLGIEGHTAVCLSGGAGLIETLKNMKPDLLLLDVMMPGMSGIDLLGMVRAVPALEYLPVVMLTGVMDLEIQSQAFKLGATDYIVKDFDWEKSLGRIEQHLRKN